MHGGYLRDDLITSIREGIRWNCKCLLFCNLLIKGKASVLNGICARSFKIRLREDMCYVNMFVWTVNMHSQWYVFGYYFGCMCSNLHCLSMGSHAGWLLYYYPHLCINDVMWYLAMRDLDGMILVLNLVAWVLICNICLWVHMHIDCCNVICSSLCLYQWSNMIIYHEWL